MPAPKGNQFWRARSSHGRKPKFQSPGKLWDACCEYFQWVEDNPLYEYRPMKTNDGVEMQAVPKMRAMTIGGLQIFLDISHEGWRQYKQREDYSAVTSRVEAIIRDQKFSGASAELLNPQIIARDLGLKDQQEVSGPDGGPIEITDTEKATRLATILNLLNRKKDDGSDG